MNELENWLIRDGDDETIDPVLIHIGCLDPDPNSHKYGSIAMLSGELIRGRKYCHHCNADVPQVIMDAYRLVV